ncbi:MAG: hypothetical protein SPF16_02775 [Prevotella sp.]|nr:hypothetical protein [Prevotella sp.]
MDLTRTYCPTPSSGLHGKRAIYGPKGKGLQEIYQRLLIPETPATDILSHTAILIPEAPATCILSHTTILIPETPATCILSHTTILQISI